MNLQDIDSETHSRLSPSAAERTHHCPGWRREADAYGIEQKLAAADYGTLAHYAAQIVSNSTSNAQYYTRHLLPGSEHVPTQTINQEMANHIDEYVDYCHNIYVSTLKAAGSKDLVVNFVERRVGITHLHKEAHGTADRIIGRHFGPLHVIDLKYGVSPVSPFKCFQLMEYGLFALMELGDFDPIFLHIYQPRAGRKDPERIWKVSSRELRQHLKVAVGDRRAAEKPDAPLAEGKGCFFCPARHGCPVFEKKNLNGAADVFGDFEV